MGIRPIDANALFDALYDNEFQTFCPLDEVSDVIAAAPTLDYEPVRHGEWKEYGCNTFCTNCGEKPLYDYFGKLKLSKRCPNCGAKMRKGEA